MTDYVPIYSSDSLYASTGVGQVFLDYYVHRPIIPHSLDQVLVLSRPEYNFRPDLFSLDYYGHEDLFWVVPVRSGFSDLVFDFRIGATIIVPDPSYIKDLLG